MAGGETRVPPPAAGPAWLLQAKVDAPVVPENYLRRTGLDRVIVSTLQRRLTVFQAPAGFGKTTVMADINRRKKSDGIAVGWLSVDEDDSPDVFGHYLARAIQKAGVDLTGEGDEDVWSSSRFIQQFGLLARAIEAHGFPCLLLLDEVERLPTPTVALLDLLLKRSPSNLHLCLAFRVNPGLDLMPHVLNRSALVVEAAKLRFSRADIVRFYGTPLSRPDLDSIQRRTAGWPVALMIDRNTRTGAAGGLGGDTPDFSANFVGLSLLRRMSKEDRAHLFDVAVFNWVGPDIVDEVLESSDVRLRVTNLPQLDGLFLPAEEDRSLLRLHPLVKEYCTARLATENPKRKRFLHRRIAVALSRRGRHRLAWRHAALAEDNNLVGELIEGVGVFELWLRQGAEALETANRYLSPEVIHAFPRLGLLRCVILHFLGEPRKAAALFESVGRQTDGFSRDREGGNETLLALDRFFAETILMGGWPASAETGFDSLMPEKGASERISEHDRMIVGGWHLVRSVFHCQFADFGESRHHGREAQALFAGDMPQGEFFASIYLGMGAMARGKVAEALDAYQRARRLTRKRFPSDWRLAASVDLVLIELDLERNREKAIRQRALKDLTNLRGVWNELFATAVSVRAELTLKQYDGDSVISFLATATESVRGSGFGHLATHVALVQAYYLARLGRVEESARLWTDEGLPSDLPELLEVSGQSWRLVEALWCARIALLAEQGKFDPALELADAGWKISEKYGIGRVAMRCLGSGAFIAQRAGQEDRALERMAAALRLTREFDYYRELANAGDVGRALIRKLATRSDEPELVDAAEAALRHLGERIGPAPEFSPRELDVLAEVQHGLRNKEIASFLGVSEEGVRFHLRNIYRKTGRSDRRDAVRYAESKGLLP